MRLSYAIHFPFLFHSPPRTLVGPTRPFNGNDDDDHRGPVLAKKRPGLLDIEVLPCLTWNSFKLAYTQGRTNLSTKTLFAGNMELGRSRMIKAPCYGLRTFRN